VLWAAYPGESDSLADRPLAVVSIYGTLDGLATVEKIHPSRPLLPSDTRWGPLVRGDTLLESAWHDTRRDHAGGSGWLSQATEGRELGPRALGVDEGLS
jgi:hypothetical protein